VPGVAEVTWITWFGGYYQEPKNFVFALPIDTDTYFNLHKDEFVVERRANAGVPQHPHGALVNAALMKKFGWKVGDRMPLHSTIWTQKADGSLDWTFDIVGTFDVKDPTQAASRPRPCCFTTSCSTRAAASARAGRLVSRSASTIPRSRPRSRPEDRCAVRELPNETKTQPAKDFAIAFIKQLGDIGFVLRAILGAVFFTLLFLTGNTMMQSVRERIPELAVLKTLGFSDGNVLGLVLAESLLLCVIGALLGLALSFARCRSSGWGCRASSCRRLRCCPASASRCCSR
jgi:putative ABC transport system permease protein